jgi:hypothetical protein
VTTEVLRRLDAARKVLAEAHQMIRDGEGAAPDMGDLVDLGTLVDAIATDLAGVNSHMIAAARDMAGLAPSEPAQFAPPVATPPAGRALLTGDRDK